MKTFLVLSMAIVASQAFFLPNDFFTDIAHRMTDLHHAVRPQGQFSHRPHPPLIPLPEATNDATHQRMTDLFNSLTPEEQAAMKNHLFGERFPRPMPAAHHGGHPKFSDEQIEAARAKWNSMTPEQQKAFREKYQKPQAFGASSSESSESSEEVRVRRPRSIQAVKPLPEQLPTAPVIRHHQASDEKLKAIREKWDSMTPEEREAMRNNRRKDSPRSFQAIQPLPEFEAPVVRPANHREHKRAGEEQLRMIQERWEAMTPAEREAVKNGRRKHYKAGEIPFAPKPRPEKPVRTPRQFQAIQPLEGPLNPGDHRRPNFPTEGLQQAVPLRPYNVALNPETDYTAMLEKLKGMTQEEQIKYIRELYPQGLPIRPLSEQIDPHYSRPVNPIQPAEGEMKIQPYLFPIAYRPLLPMEVQPIFPLPYFQDPEETNFLGPIPLPNRDEPEEEVEEDEDAEDEEEEE